MSIKPSTCYIYIKDVGYFERKSYTKKWIFLNNKNDNYQVKERYVEAALNKAKLNCVETANEIDPMALQKLARIIAAQKFLGMEKIGKEWYMSGCNYMYQKNLNRTEIKRRKRKAKKKTPC